jgi:hypothetical protein
MQNPASIALLNEFTANDNFNGQKAQWRTFCNHALEFRLAAMVAHDQIDSRNPAHLPQM